jgi:UDP-glucose 4-epimerase
MKDKAILIIGSKGFIGSNLFHYLFKQECNVIGCDITNDLSERYIQIDPINPDFESIFKAYTFSVCINASGSSNIVDSFQNPYKNFFSNTINTFKILEAIKIHSPECKFINLSSAAVYGNPIKIPISEESETSPISPYGFHKLQNETICKEFTQLFEIQTCSLRIFSAYGPGLKRQILWDLSQKTKQNDIIELFGTGEESRDFIYINDICQVINLLIEAPIFNWDILNVANGKEIKIKELVKIYQVKSGSFKKVVFTGKEKKGDPQNWKADISRISDLGYQPSTDFETGVENYIKWLEKESV